MKTTNYNICLDPIIKAKSESTFAEFGLNLSEAINIFLHMAIESHGFPFEIHEPKLKSDTLMAIQESEQILEEYSDGIRTAKHFSNANEMFAAMDLEDKLEEENE